jgi:putative RNA 2'-phosphotransferase
MPLSDYNPKRLSKTITVWLRHHPEQAMLSPDEYGWVDIEQIIQALAKRDVFVTAREIEILNHSTDKVRWNVDIENNRIRTTHGHTIPVILADHVTPPEVLYHGTYSDVLSAITKQGLLPMKRQFVHLSADKSTAHSVGLRHAKGEESKVHVFEIKAKTMAEYGHKFYNTSNNVWLTKNVPPEFLTKNYLTSD